MFCTQCGRQNPEGNRFCAGCGVTLRSIPRPAQRSSKALWIVGGLVFLVLVVALLVWLTGTPLEQVIIDVSGGTKQFPKSGVQLEIPPGATQESVSVKLNVVPTPPAPPEGTSILGSAYDIRSEVAAFDEPVRLSLPVPSDKWPIPAGELVTIATWNEELQDWVPLGSELDEQQKTVSTWVSHFSQYALINWNPQKPNAVAMKTTQHFHVVGLSKPFSEDPKQFTKDVQRLTPLVERVAGFLEEAWSLVINQLGYREPRLIARDKRIWVWITPIVERDWAGFVGEPPKTLARSLPDMNIYLSPQLNKETPLHEFFHVVQIQGYLNRYRYEPAALWWMEATSAWVQTRVQDASKVYRKYYSLTKTELLKHSLDDPGVTKDDPEGSNDAREYLAGVFASYLESRFGTEIIRRTWEIISAQVQAGQTANPLKAIENALSERGASLSDIYFSFALDYAYFRTSPWLGFLPAFKTEEVEVSTSQQTKTFSLPHMSCQFNRLIARRDKGTLKVAANADASIRYAVIDEPSKNVVHPSAGAAIQVAGFGATTKSAVLIACNTALQDKREFRFSYAVGREVTQEPPPIPVNPIAVVETSMGTFKIELFADKAPNTVKNFIDLVNRGFYRDMIFHRVVPGFIIQTGDPTGTGRGGSERAIKLETHPTLKHSGPGVVGMARASGEDASSQFYITLSEASHLDGSYAVFGRVIEGLDVVMKIGRVEVGPGDRPLKPVILKSITLEMRSQETSTLTVCSSGCSFSRIQDAINAAAPGATIEIGPGIYYENLEIAKNLTLQGVSTSSSGQVVIKFAKSNAPVIRIVGQSKIHVLVKGLMINGTEESSCSSTECWAILEISGLAQVSLENIIVSSRWNIGLLIEDEAEVSITRSLFYGDGGRGLQVTDKADVVLTDVQVYSWREYGIFVSGKARLTLTNSQVYNNKNESGAWGYGITAMGESRLSLANSQIYGNGLGLQIALKAQLILMNSQVSNNERVGLKVSNEAQADVRNTIVEGNGYIGIFAVGAVQLAIIDSTIRNNADWGVAATLKACGSYSDIFTGQVFFQGTNAISGNNQSGRQNGQGNPGNHPWNRSNVPDGQVCLPEGQAGIQPPIRRGVSLGYVNVKALETLSDISIDEVRARLKVMSGEKPDLVLKRQDVILFADHTKVVDLTQAVRSRASIAASAGSLRKIAYINAERVFQDYRKTSELVQTFRVEAERKQQELKALQDRFKRGLISEDAFERERVRIQQELQKLDLELTTEIHGDMLKAIEQIAQEGGIDWVTKRKDVVLFANPEVVIDLTDLVTRKLNGEQVDSELAALPSIQAPTRIAYVYFNRAYSQYKGTKEAIQRFRAEAEKKQQELKDLQEKFKKGWLSEDQFQRESARIQEELQRFDLELTAKVQYEIISVIEGLAKRENYDIVFEKGAILFANEEKIADLTDQVISHLSSASRTNTPAPSQGYPPQIISVDVPSQIPPETPISVSVSFTDLDGDVRGVEILDCSLTFLLMEHEPRCPRVMDNSPLQSANVKGVTSGVIKITLKCMLFPYGAKRKQKIILYDDKGFSSAPFEFAFECTREQTLKGTNSTTLTVCPSGCAFSRIQDAINVATPGATVKIGPGTYYENLEIRKSLTAQGAGAEQTQIKGIEHGRPVVLILGDTNIEVRIENLIIAGAKLSAPTDTCTAQRQKSFCSAGILVSGRAKVILENSEISRNDADGVWAMDSVNVLINNTKIFDNAKQCLAAYETEKIQCFGIDVSDAAQVTVLNSTISANAMTGFIVRNSAQAKIQSSTISRNGRFGLVVQNVAEIWLEDSVISQNGWGGVGVGNAAKVELHRGVIEGNGVDANCDQRWLCNGVDVADEAQVGITESTIRNNNDWGVATRLDKCDYKEESFNGQVILQGNNVIEGNGLGQVCLPDHVQP